MVLVISMKKFEWVDHPADVGFRAYGESLEEAFENAALAITELMVDSDRIEPEEEVSVEIQSEDLEALLFDWLDHFLYLQGAKGFISSEFEVEEISGENGEYRLKGIARGEKYSLQKHGPGSEVKAITYHMMEINQRPDRSSVRVVVDV